MKKLVINSMLVSFALILTYVEKLIPVNVIVPVPGIKLGLANIVTIFVLFGIGMRSALIVTFVRCFIANMLFGSFISLLLSLSGAFAALMVMALLKKGFNKVFSIIGISIAGAAAHGIGQILAAAFILKSNAVFPYLSVLLLASLITGTITASAANLLFNNIGKIEVFRRYKIPV